MKPSSRALPPGRPHRTTVGVRRPPRRLPLRLVETPPPGDPSAGVEVADAGTVRRRRGRLVRRTLLAIAIVVLLVECFAIVRSVRRDADPGGTPAAVAPLLAPAALPEPGSLVQSEIRADGDIAVTQWIRGTGDITEVTLAAPPAGGPADLRAVGTRLVAADGTVLADDLTVGAKARRIRFESPTRLLRATYVLRDAVDRSSTVDGRLRALAASLDVDTPAAAGPAVVVVTGAGEVLNLACANARSGVALLRPCGSPDGSGWRVRLPAGGSGDRVVAQLDAP